MKLTVLGSGTCVPSLIRNAPGYLLEEAGKHVLVDCGSGTLLQLEKIGKSFRDIDAVFITHLHPDHFSDLMPLVHALVSAPGYKREKELLVAGPEGFMNYYEDAFVPILRKRDFIKLIEVDSEAGYGPFHVDSTKTAHSANSLAYRFEAADRSVVFTGDTDHDQGLIEFSKNADLLVADASFPYLNKMKGHLSAKECGLIAEEANVKHLLLSHIYQIDEPDDARLKECREVFGGKSEIAEDLMCIKL